MKLSRSAAIGAAALLVAGSTFMIGATASADDFYVQDTQFGHVVDGDPYLASWFTGDTGTTPVIDSTVAGLSLTGTQILNGTPTTSDLATLVDGANFTLASGDANFQIAMYVDGATDGQFTTLRPDNFGPVGLNPLAGWTTSGAFGTFAAESSHTIPEYVAEAAAQSYTPEILAFGVIAPANAVVASITWDGNTHWFLPAPTATITPASLTVADVSDSAKGVTGVFTGFIPNEAIIIGLGTGSSGGDIDTATADANGVVTYRYVASAAGAAVGNYTLYAFGQASGVSGSATFAVTANILPVTGADFTPTIVAGGLLLLVGSGFLVAVRRRATSSRR